MGIEVAFLGLDRPSPNDGLDLGCPSSESLALLQRAWNATQIVSAEEDPASKSVCQGGRTCFPFRVEPIVSGCWPATMGASFLFLQEIESGVWLEPHLNWGLPGLLPGWVQVSLNSLGRRESRKTALYL